MQADEVDFLIKLLYKRSGLALTAEKQYLLESRLSPIATANGHKDISAMVGALKVFPMEKLLCEVTEAMTTNETSFFRDGKPFEQLRQTVLPQLRLNAGARRNLRIWSAACSAGQEPYTIAMTLREDESRNPGWKYEIVATDLAAKVVEKAREGVYSQFEVQRGMPIQMLLKYFKANPDTTWQAKDELRAMVTFRAQNLLSDFSALGRFDLIFCRNVLIYFDEQTKAGLIERMCDLLDPGGYLILGSTESILERNNRLRQPDGLRGIYKVVERSLKYA